jgi:hypothetical protein
MSRNTTQFWLITFNTSRTKIDNPFFYINSYVIITKLLEFLCSLCYEGIGLLYFQTCYQIRHKTLIITVTAFHLFPEANSWMLQPFHPTYNHCSPICTQMHHTHYENLKIGNNKSSKISTGALEWNLLWTSWVLLLDFTPVQPDYNNLLKLHVY